MSAPTTTFVRTGFWLDYSRSRFYGCVLSNFDFFANHVTELQSLVSSSHAQIWTNGVGITLTILLNGFVFAVFFWSLKALSVLCDCKDLEDLCETLKDSEGSFQAVKDIFMHNIVGHPRVQLTNPAAGPSGFDAIVDNWQQFVRNWRTDKRHIIKAALTMVLLTAVIVGLNVGFAFVAAIANNSLGLSDSPFCDVWVNPSGASASTARYVENEAERRAQLYVSTCYDKPDGTDGCNLYFNQSLTFRASNTSCPFGSNACDETGGPAVLFDTGYLDSKVLGINTKRSPLIRRSTVCSPAATDNRYIQLHDGPWGKVTEYYYGNSRPGKRWNGIDSDFTWNSSVTFTKDVPSYSVASYRSRSSRDQAYVLPEFRVVNHTTTLLIIEEGLIFHPQERGDPVFSAHNQTSDPMGLDIWYNGVHHGGVMMCVDSWEICPAEEKSSCWNTDNAPLPLPSTTSPTEAQVVYELLRYALQNSNNYASTRRSLGSELDAQRHIDNFFVTGLANQQWRVEAQLLFQASLARLQQDIHDIQRGTAKDVHGFQRTLPKAYRGMCRLYKFRTVGMTNVDVMWTFVLLIGGFALWTAMRTFDESFIFVRVGKGVGAILRFAFCDLPPAVFKFAAYCYSRMRDMIS